MLSGNLGLETLKSLTSEFQLVCIFTDGGSGGIIQYAQKQDIDCFVGNPRGGRAASFISGKAIDVLLSVNYLFLIENDLIKWPTLGAINLHGSLLPKYRGRTPHVWAIINNEKETGVTAHLMALGCDEGDILKQREVAIGPEDTGADILKKYEKVYPELIREVLNDVQTGNLEPLKQDESKATYFGKRTPADGQINWEWQKERIRNWVRAQANPYPGAFTWLGSEKVIIDRIEYDDYGFDQSMDNGLILTSRPLRVKTPNGAIRVTSMRAKHPTFKAADRFIVNENR